MSTALSTAPRPSQHERRLPKLCQGTRKRILVVDDDAGVLMSLGRLFHVLDVDIETCADPVEAMRRFEEGRYDLVISDERMPRMSGTDLLKKMRATSPRTPTILMTAYGDAKQFNSAYEDSGVFRYLTKPWDNFDLVVTVREALRAAEALA